MHQQFERSLEARGNSRLTVKVRHSHLSTFRRHYPDLLAVRASDLEEFFAGAHQVWSPSYVKNMRTTVTMFYTWAAKHDLIELNPADDLPPVRVPRAIPRPVPENRVLDAFSAGTLAERAIIALAQTQGLRREEIATAHPIHRDGQTLRVIGKGSKERIVPLDFLTYSILREIEVEQGADKFYFPGRFVGHLHPATVYKWVKALLPEYSIHNLRHTAGSNGLHKTHDVRAVQELLGHESLDTTMIYTFVADESIRAVVEANSLARLLPSILPTTPHPAQPPTNSIVEHEAIVDALLTLQRWMANQPNTRPSRNRL